MTLEELNLRALPPGTLLLEKYRVVDTIGVGGMGVVVACDHLALGARVAIKFVLPELVANQNIVQRFLNEARAAIRIQSDHVARVLDVGSMTGPGLPPRGVPYRVMEYLHGRDLASWIKSGVRFSITDAIDFAAQAGEALAQAHKVGIIHRDVKPANLFLAEYEARRVVKVLDFGISKILEEAPQEMGLTKTTTVLGSGLYMSPEQMRSAKNVDLRTDVYALGVCIYELLTGTHPFTAESFSELCVKVNIDAPTPLRAHRPEVPEELAAAIAKAYARSPADRYASMAEVAAALAPFSAPLSLATLRKMQRQSLGEFRTPSVLPPVPDPAGIAPALAPAAVAPAHRAVPVVTAQVTTERDPSSALLTERNLTATAGALTTGPHEPPAAKTRKVGLLAAAGLAAFVGAISAGSWLKRNSAPAAPTPTGASQPGASQPGAGQPAASEPAASRPVPRADTSAASASERADEAPTPVDASAPPASGSVSGPATSASTDAPQAGDVPVPQPRGPSATARPAGSGSGHAPTPTGARPPNRSCKKTDPVTGLMVPCDFGP